MLTPAQQQRSKEVGEYLERRKKLQKERRNAAIATRAFHKENFDTEKQTWRTNEARRQWNSLCEEYDLIIEQLGDVQERLSGSPEDVLKTIQEHDDRQEPGPFSGDTRTVIGSADSHIDTGVRFQLADGREVRGLTHQHRLSDLMVDREKRRNISLGRCFRSIVMGLVGELNDYERRELSMSSGPDGSFTAGTTLSNMIVDFARAASVCMRAGALTLPMDTSEMTIARISTDVAGSWREENTNVAISNPMFDRVLLKPKVLALRIPMSHEIMDDARNLMQVMENAVSQSLGAGLDAAILAGAGAEAAPLGIINTTGVNTVTSVGTPANYDDFSGAVGDVFEANYPGDPEQLAWILRPTDAGTLDVLKDSQNQPLQPSPWVQALRRFYTTGLTSGYSIIGDFSQVVVGLRTSGVRIRVIDAGTNSDGNNLADNLQRQLIAYLRADVAVLRPSWMTVLSGITSS